MTSVRLQITSEALNDRAVQEIAQTLQDDIARHTDARAAPPETAVEPNKKGDPITLGVLVLTFLTSGSAVALFNLLKAYLERDPNLSFVIERPGGVKITFGANNLQEAEQIARSLVAETPG